MMLEPVQPALRVATHRDDSLQQYRKDLSDEALAGDEFVDSRLDERGFVSNRETGILISTPSGSTRT